MGPSWKHSQSRQARTTPHLALRSHQRLWNACYKQRYLACRRWSLCPSAPPQPKSNSARQLSALRRRLLRIYQPSHDQPLKACYHRRLRRASDVTRHQRLNGVVVRWVRGRCAMHVVLFMQNLLRSATATQVALVIPTFRRSRVVRGAMVISTTQRPHPAAKEVAMTTTLTALKMDGVTVDFMVDVTEVRVPLLSLLVHWTWPLSPSSVSMLSSPFVFLFLAHSFCNRRGFRAFTCVTSFRSRQS